MYKRRNPKPRRKYNQLYYYFRDFYLLYALDTTQIAYNTAKEKYMRENPDIPEKELPDIKFFLTRLHKEFKQGIINAYRYKGQPLKKEYQRKILDKEPSKLSKRTIKNVPEYFDFSINETLNASRIALTGHLKELCKNKEVVLETNNRVYTFKVDSNEDYSDLRYGDLVFDFLLGCIHLWKNKKKKPDGYVCISIDDLAFLRLQEGYQSGFKVKDKELYKKYFDFLNTITVSVDNSEEIQLILAKNKSGSQNQLDYYFNLKIEEILLQNTDGRLETYLLRYPIFTRRREKRMGYLLNYYRRKVIKELRFELREVFTELGTYDYLRKKAHLERLYLEGLLEDFKNRELIASWNYEGVTNKIMNRQKWLKDFIKCLLVINISA